MKQATDSDPRAVVERYIAEVLSGAGPGRPEDLIANDTFLQKLAGFRAAFPDLAITTHLLFAAGPYVAVHVTGRATHLGLFQGVPPTGRTWAAGCTAAYRVEDGKIVDFWVNWDLLAILEQIGGVTRTAMASA